MTVPARIPRARFPLFTKIIAGFTVVILIMIGLATTTLLQLRPLGAENKPEARVTPHSLYMETLWKIENDAARRYLEGRKDNDEQKLLLTRSQFLSSIDTLVELTKDNEDSSIVREIAGRFSRFDELLRSDITRLKANPGYDALASFQSRKASGDSLTSALHAVTDAYLGHLIKSYDKFDRQRPVAITTGYFILALALLISAVVGLYVARTVTRPIQALKAGTEKVSQAVYETVPVTSHDEIAELTIAFNSMSDKLKKLDEMRMALMSEISHEMRTPLQVIKAGCYSIIHTKEGPALNQRQRDAVGMIHQATNRINRFINSFLDIAKMEAGLMIFNYENASLVDLLNPLVQEAQLIGQTRQIEVSFTSDQIPPLMIDKDRMSQVFSNLFSNALKYTPDSGKIAVTITKSDDCSSVGKDGRGCVQIDVRDSGVGIPEADLAKLFSKFFQAHNVPLVNEKGSGLGLALVKHVTEAHGGRVSVTSQVGSGSTFSILLPC